MTRLAVLTLALIILAALPFRDEKADARPLWLPQVENPYCAVPTFVLPDIPEQAVSLNGDDGEALIVLSSNTIRNAPAYSHFLMAHECCHHSLGHVQMLKRELGQMGPQPFFYIKPALRSMELEADCCAVRMLKRSGELDSIAAGEKTMASFGEKPTGAYYPTGRERSVNISNCAAIN